MRCLATGRDNLGWMSQAARGKHADCASIAGCLSESFVLPAILSCEVWGQRQRAVDRLTAGSLSRCVAPRLVVRTGACADKGIVDA